MKQFFDDDLILGTDTAKELYASVRDLPVVDYHCHLRAGDIARDARFSDIGELWLREDHYKWRVMRICGVPEEYITGDRPWREKFLAFAEIMPSLFGNPVYYWAQLELKSVFGVNKPLNGETAEYIMDACNERLRDISVRTLLDRFKVRFVATTDDPLDDLRFHGRAGNTLVTPTFRPDKAFLLDDAYYERLSGASGVRIDCAAALVEALERRLDFFASKGCRLSDHDLPAVPDFCGDEEAERIFSKRTEGLAAGERDRFAGWLLMKIARMCGERGIASQWHIGALRNASGRMFGLVGPDSGLDVFGPPPDENALVRILDGIDSGGRAPGIILYSLHPSCDRTLAAVSGAFPNVRAGAAWWFNDTLEGIREHLRSVMEYGVLGRHLGMLTDSRSFTSYVRHDYFRRILCDLAGNLVERGEYDASAAPGLVRGICFSNAARFLGLNDIPE